MFWPSIHSKGKALPKIWSKGHNRRNYANHWWMTGNEGKTLFQRVILRWGQHEGILSQATEVQAGKVKLDINYDVNQDFGPDSLFPKSMECYWFMACITFIGRVHIIVRMTDWWLKVWLHPLLQGAAKSELQHSGFLCILLMTVRVWWRERCDKWPSIN